MKMSFFWMLMIVINLYNIISDIATNDYTFWIGISAASLGISIWLYFDALKTERREAEAKRQLINIVINHAGTEDPEETARRITNMNLYSR